MATLDQLSILIEECRTILNLLKARGLWSYALLYDIDHPIAQNGIRSIKLALTEEATSQQTVAETEEAIRNNERMARSASKTLEGFVPVTDGRAIQLSLGAKTQSNTLTRKLYAAHDS